MGETSQGQQFTEISWSDFLLPMTFCLHLPSSRDQPSMPRTWTHREARWLARSRRSRRARCSCSSTRSLSPGSCCGRMRPDRSCRSETSFLLDLPQLVLVEEGRLAWSHEGGTSVGRDVAKYTRSGRLSPPHTELSAACFGRTLPSTQAAPKCTHRVQRRQQGPQLEETRCPRRWSQGPPAPCPAAPLALWTWPKRQGLAVTVLNVGTGQDSTPCPRLSPTRLLSNCRNHSFFSSFCKPGLSINVHVSVMQTFGFPRLDHKLLSNVLTGLFFSSLFFMLRAPDPFCQLSTDGDSHLCFGFFFKKGGRLSQATGSWLTRSVLTAFAWFCQPSVPWSSLCPLQIWLTHFRFFPPFVRPAVNHERAEWEYSCIEWSSPVQTILSQGSPVFLRIAIWVTAQHPLLPQFLLAAFS